VIQDEPLLRFCSEGIYCVPGRFYIDPWRPVAKALIMHGHADHAREGMQHYLCHHFTVPILKARIGADIQVQGIAYNEPTYLNGVKVSFHPAGHIIGSGRAYYRLGADPFGIRRQSSGGLRRLQSAGRWTLDAF